MSHWIWQCLDSSAPACDCSCHTTPGVMHVAACCSTGLTAHNKQEQR